MAHIPVVKARLGLDDRALGLGLFGLSAGAVVAMQAIGPLVRRTGTRAANRLGTVILAAGLVPTAHATGLAALVVALFAFGMGIGLLDVAMNAQAAEVENGYRRPVMAAFHAGWSVSAMAGAAAGGLAIRAGWPMSRTVAVGAAVVGLLTLLASRWLLPPTQPASRVTVLAAREGATTAVPATAAGSGLAAALGPAGPRPGGDGPHRDRPHRDGSDRDRPRRDRSGRGPARHRLPLVVWLLGGLCFGSFLCEGAAADWAGVHLRDSLGAPTGLAAFGFAAFAGAMTAGRLMADRVVAAVGGLPVLRFGGALAAAGTLTVVTAPVPAVAVAGWAATGLGLAGVVPLLFSAAANIAPTAAGPAGLVATAPDITGNAGATAGAAPTPVRTTAGTTPSSGGETAPGGAGDGPAALARVTSFGYLGTLVGPAVIGLLAHVVGLDAALLLLVLVGVAIAVAAPVRLAGYGRSRAGLADGDSIPQSQPAHVADGQEV